MCSPARPPVAAPSTFHGFVLTATVAGLFAVATGCEAPVEKSAWEKAGATTSEAVEDAKEVAVETAEDGWEAIKDSSGKAWDTTRKKSAAALEEVKKAAGIVNEQ